MIFSKFYFFIFIYVIVYNLNLGFSQNETFKTFYYPNSTIKQSEGFLKDGKPVGIWQTFYRNGNLKSKGERVNFLLDKEWSFYYENGNIKNIITYRNNQKNGFTTDYDTLGRMTSKTNYKDDVKQGKSFIYYKNGVIHYEMMYKNNALNGLYIEYDTLGRMITQSRYENGMLRYSEQMNRLDEKGRKNGIWKTFYPNGEEKKVVNYIHGKANGYAKFYNERGGLTDIKKYNLGVEVQQDDNLLFSTLKKKYLKDNGYVIGTYKKGKKNGLFRYYDSTNTLVKCLEFENDVKLSKGMLDTVGLKDKEWTYFYKDGKVRIKGIYKSGKREGVWSFFYKNGELEQKGKYKKGLFTGEWKWWHQNGLIHREETFFKGKEDGDVMEYDTIGELITKGSYLSGVREGEWFYFINDYKEEGQYIDGLKHGQWKHYNKKGKVIFQGAYLNGNPVKNHLYFFENGNVKLKSKYNNAGQKNGKWVYYKENGDLFYSVVYKNGVEKKIIW